MLDLLFYGAKRITEAELREFKFELFKSAIERRQHVGVRYWRVVEDPAVISLGGGIVSLATGTASYLDDDWVTLRAGDLEPGTVISEELGLKALDLKHAIPRREVLDLLFYGAKRITEAELREFAGDA